MHTIRNDVNETPYGDFGELGELQNFMVHTKSWNEPKPATFFAKPAETSHKI